MTDPHNRPVLSDGTVTLRAPIAADVDARLALGQSIEITQWFGMTPDDMSPTYTQEHAENWVNRKRDDPLSFIIEADGTLAGSVFLHSVDHKDHRGEIAVGLLAPAQLGKGIGTRALRLLLTHAFDTLGLNRIGLRYLEGNARARACYEKLGFQYEGRLRERACVGGVFKDDLQMGLLAREFIR